MKLSTIILIAILSFFTTSLYSESLKLTPVQKKKQNFYTLVLPAVNSVYDELQKQYIDILEHHHDPIYDPDLKRLKKEYKVTTNQELLVALKPHPKSIAIAQAAMESAWGTSRFFREANNIFGVWSLNSYDQRIAAKGKRGTKTIWLKKYNILDDSIRDYYRTLGRNRAYKEFRKLKMQTSDPYKLVEKLNHYSERGDEYCNELASMIRYNNLRQYDK